MRAPQYRVIKSVLKFSGEDGCAARGTYSLETGEPHRGYISIHLENGGLPLPFSACFCWEDLCWGKQSQGRGEVGTVTSFGLQVDKHI